MDANPIPLQNASLQDASLSEIKAHLCDLICQVAYKEGNFVLSSGQASTYYINGKQVTLHPQGALMVARLLLDCLPADTVGVGGLTLGADPLVSTVSLVAAYAGRWITPLIVRKEAKGHGTQAYIEGPTLAPGSPVVVLEDVVTTGSSALKAITRLRDAGYQVTHIVSLVDRQQGGAELYAEQGLNFQAIYTIQDIQARYRQIH
jgi:orotate phosphoribosyltransferase